MGQGTNLESMRLVQLSSFFCLFVLFCLFVCFFYLIFFFVCFFGFPMLRLLLFVRVLYLIYKTIDKLHPVQRYYIIIFPDGIYN